MSSKLRSHWFRVVAEGLAIVVSILFAFAIDRWWDARRQEGEANELLLNLHDEFSANREELALQLVRYSSTVTNTMRVRRWASGEQVDVPPDSLLNVFQSVLHPATLDLATGVVSEVLSSGGLGLIENARLRTAISGWRGTIAEGVDREPWEHVVVHEQLRPLLTRLAVFPPLRRQTGEVAWANAQEMIDTLRARAFPDPEFQGQLNTRLDWAIVNTLNKRNLLSALDETLELLEEEILNRGLSPRASMGRTPMPDPDQLVALALQDGGLKIPD